MIQLNRFEQLHLPQNTPEEDESCCDAPDVIISDDGIQVCRNCGVTFGQELVSHERRAFTTEEIRNRRITEPRWRPFGPRTVIARIRIDAKGRPLPAKKQVLFARLSKIHGSLINSMERNYWVAKPKISALATRFAIPDYIAKTAWNIYREVARQKLTVGRSIEAFARATLYAAIRIHNFPRMLDELCDASLSPTGRVQRALTLVIRHVLPTLNLKYKPIKPETLVYWFGNDLNLGIGVQKSAAKLLKDALRNGLYRTGKDPKGLAAAEIYMVAKDSSEYKSQAQVAEVSYITEVTLGSSARQIEVYRFPRTAPVRE